MSWQQADIRSTGPLERSALSDLAFERMARNSLEKIITSRIHRGVTKDFYAAYQRRSSVAWLGESGNLPGLTHPNGLTYALRYALSTYEPVRARDAGSLLHSMAFIRPFPEFGIGELLTASAHVLDDDTCLLEFRMAILRGRPEAELNDREIESAVLEALRQYATNDSGIDDSSPW